MCTQKKMLMLDTLCLSPTLTRHDLLSAVLFPYRVSYNSTSPSTHAPIFEDFFPVPAIIVVVKRSTRWVTRLYSLYHVGTASSPLVDTVLF